MLAECWVSIRDALPELPSLPWYEPGGYADRLVYMVLSLAPNAVRSFSAGELDYLAAACIYDPRLMRHLLSWASSYPSTTKDGEQLGSTSVSRWTQLARWYRNFFPEEEQSLAWFDWSSQVGEDLARRLIGDVDLDDLIEVHWPCKVWTRFGLLAPLVELNPALARTAAKNTLVIEDFFKEASEIEIDLPASLHDRELWRTSFVQALSSLPMSDLDHEALKVGWVAGYELHLSGLPRTAHAVAQVLRKDPDAVKGTRTCETALLWADLQQLVEYQQEAWKNRDEIRGVLARLSSRVKSSPEAWTVSAREILTHAKTLGSQVVDLLCLCAAQHAPLRDTLEKIARSDQNRAVRDRTQGLLARTAGVATPSEDVRRWLADLAAQAFDDTPLFPNPLTSLAQTWLGSIDLDATLPNAIRQAMSRFSEFAKDQGAVAVEEHVTGVLLTELEAAFRGVSLRLIAGGQSRLARTISVSHRPTHKTTEEPQWGCDIALLLNADIRPDIRIELAELVQIKKSQAFAAGKSAALHEKWRIDVPQLVALLKRSQSAGYWLVLSTGEVVCLTARWIHALVSGRDALGQHSLTIGYNDIRHAAVPVEQYLPELFLGTWIGSADESTVTFARGENANAKPRHIFEVSVIANQG
ncbi:hypothetical protein GCM10023196_088050 [Actinoallomurus vinaceus]|uniref:Uncharacterized protein n=1 Tax=Actinoallomurus vinaceus TaxID=1080074 RepID=A0ABP8UTG7_9ACTN